VNTRQQSYAGQIVARIAELRQREAGATLEPQRAALRHMLRLWRLELSLVEREVAEPIPDTSLLQTSPHTRASAAVSAIAAISAELEVLEAMRDQGSPTDVSLRSRRIHHLLVDLASARRLLASVEMHDD